MTQERASGSPSAARRWGFAAMVVLAIAAWAGSVVQVERARDDLAVLARTADRSAALIAELGQLIGRLRAEALAALVGDPDAGANLPDVSATLDATLDELEPLLAPEQRRRWNGFRPLLDRFRAHVGEVVAAVRRGDAAGAHAVAADLNPVADRLQTRLDELTWFSENQSARLLAAADAMLARVVMIESVLGAGLLAGLVAIWGMVLRTLARQRHALEEYVARVESSNRDLDAFAGRIAHDLGNALAPVGFGAASLRRLAGRPESVARIAGQLEATVQRTRGLIEGLLAFSRAGRGAESKETARLAETLQSVLEELTPLATRVDATLDVQLADAEVACPPGLLHLVAANLIGNALKFLEGRPVRRVTARARVLDGGWCELAIADTGPGIPRASLHRIFEPFYRVPGTAAEGTGIGLATVYRIVTAHGGTIGVDSDVGRGTTFRVRLILRPERRPATDPGSADAGV